MRTQTYCNIYYLPFQRAINLIPEYPYPAIVFDFMSMALGVSRLAIILSFAHGKAEYYAFQISRNKGTDQTALISRLVCAFIVRM